MNKMHDLDSSSSKERQEVSYKENQKEEAYTYVSFLNRFKIEYAAARKRYIQIAGSINGTASSENIFVWASIDKGIRLLDGIYLALKSRNLTCCAVLYRAQIDLCMRTYAPSIAKNPQQLFEGYLKKKPVRQYVDKLNNKMTDAYLRKRLDKDFQGLSKDYRHASDYVHFSTEALYLITQVEESPEDKDAFVFTMGIGTEHGHEIDYELIKLGNCVINATHLHNVCLKRFWHPVPNRPQGKNC